MKLFAKFGLVVTTTLFFGTSSKTEVLFTDYGDEHNYTLLHETSCEEIKNSIAEHSGHLDTAISVSTNHRTANAFFEFISKNRQLATRVVDLTLGDQTLEKTPETVALMPNLHTLRIHFGNELTVPTQVGELEKLKQLEISKDSGVKCLPKSLRTKIDSHGGNFKFETYFGLTYFSIGKNETLEALVNFEDGPGMFGCSGIINEINDCDHNNVRDINKEGFFLGLQNKYEGSLYYHVIKNIITKWNAEKASNEDIPDKLRCDLTGLARAISAIDFILKENNGTIPPGVFVKNGNIFLGGEYDEESSDDDDF
ncbi:hypothetical protein HOD08_02880 [bacterium]|nr:hypothetical protein [bacterium]